MNSPVDDTVERFKRAFGPGAITTEGASMSETRRCGNCVYFSPDIVVRPGVWMGWCESLQYPKCFANVSRDEVFSDNDNYCPTWRRKKERSDK